VPKSFFPPDAELDEASVSLALARLREPDARQARDVVTSWNISVEAHPVVEQAIQRYLDILPPRILPSGDLTVRIVSNLGRCRKV
jgi:hypothetical protein